MINSAKQRATANKNKNTSAMVHQTNQLSNAVPTERIGSIDLTLPTPDVPRYKGKMKIQGYPKTFWLTGWTSVRQWNNNMPGGVSANTNIKPYMKYLHESILADHSIGNSEWYKKPSVVFGNIQIEADYTYLTVSDAAWILLNNEFHLLVDDRHLMKDDYYAATVPLRLNNGKLTMS